MSKKSRNEARLHRHKRVRKNIRGTAEKPRLNVFRSLSQISAQIIDDDKEVTLVSSSSIDHELRKKIAKLNKTEQASAVGKLLAQRAKEKQVNKVVFDRGGYRYMGRVKALAEAAREEGLIF
jgi:large subunit ribosomal protein L18